jgi:hypothetical protein
VATFSGPALVVRLLAGVAWSVSCLQLSVIAQTAAAALAATHGAALQLISAGIAVVDCRQMRVRTQQQQQQF